jgi:GRAM domain.
MPESGPPSRPDDPPLLPGEKVQGVAREVTYLCPYSGPARGVLSVTNYRLHFRSMDRDTPYVVDVPLGVVSSIICGKFSKYLPWHTLCGLKTLGGHRIQIWHVFIQNLNALLCLSWLLTFIAGVVQS